MRRFLVVTFISSGISACGHPAVLAGRAPVGQPLLQAQGMTDASIHGQIREAVQRYLDQRDPAAVIEKLSVSRSAQNGQQRFYAIIRNAQSRYQLDGHRTLSNNRCTIDGKTILKP